MSLFMSPYGKWKSLIMGCNQLQSVWVSSTLFSRSAMHWLLSVEQYLFYKTCQMNNDILETSLSTKSWEKSRQTKLRHWAHEAHPYQCFIRFTIIQNYNSKFFARIYHMLKQRHFFLRQEILSLCLKV